MLLLRSSVAAAFSNKKHNACSFPQLFENGCIRSEFMRPVLRFRHQEEEAVRSYHAGSALFLNRFLFDPSEVTTIEQVAAVTLPKEDYRTIHAAKILNLQNGALIRAGIVGRRNQTENALYHTGSVTDKAVIRWLPEGKNKKPQPTKHGDPPGSLFISLYHLEPNDDSSREKDHSASIALILALPRPLQLKRILPMIAQIGISHLVLTSASKVPRDYFGSHLFRTQHELERLLIQGLCLAGDVVLPQITVVTRLESFLADRLDELFPEQEYARVIAHPHRSSVGDSTPPLRMRNVEFPFNDRHSDNTYSKTKLLKKEFFPKMVVAVGPEGGWEEPEELDIFVKQCSFQQVSLGTRVLRSDVAVVSLLSLAHDAVATAAQDNANQRLLK